MLLSIGEPQGLRVIIWLYTGEHLCSMCCWDFFQELSKRFDELVDKLELSKRLELSKLQELSTN